MEHLVEITKGPSKMDLMFALFDGVMRRKVRFTCRLDTDILREGDFPETLDVYVLALEREGHEEWKIKAAVDDERRYTIHFNTATRMGWPLPDRVS